MKFVCLVLLVMVFSAAAIEPALADDDYVRLAIKGTNVNLWPQPRAAGSVIAQTNTGYVFFAEKRPITDDNNGSLWYKIVLPAVDYGNLKTLHEWDSRFTANAAYVSANYVMISPLERGDLERILATLARGNVSLATKAGGFEATTGGNSIYLDIDNDGVREKTEYAPENNTLTITRNGKTLVKADLDDCGVDFSGLGSGRAQYYYDYVHDSDGKIYLHIYASNYIGFNEDEENNSFTHYSSGSEAYYEIKSGQLRPVDTVKYTWESDDSGTQKIDISVNGQPVSSLKNIEAKYTAIENARYEIEYW